MPIITDPSTIQPLGDRLLVETIKETETHHGIIIPEVSQDRPEKARVLAVGPGERDKNGQLIPMDIEIDDLVIFHRHAGTHIGGLSDDYIIFRKQDILAKVVE